MYRHIALLSSLIAAASAQQAGTQTAEKHPAMSWQDCSSGSCKDVDGQVVVDSNWRWVHTTEGYTNCYTGNKWNETICTDNEACAKNCALDGADYEATYGIQADGTSLTLKFVQDNESGKNVGSRLYMMEDESTYHLFKLLNREFTFDVDVSQLGCGLNGALYFVAMSADGDMGKGDNKAGAKYGTGYCDAQCPRDLKFINGQANVEGWKPSSNDENAGVGGHGSCCAEMDVWESNKFGTAVTPHSCDTTTLTVCNGDDCGGTYSETRNAGTCDADGCDFNAFRMGDESFFGPGKTVDSSSKMTVVTQFITDDGTDNGSLSEIRRFYVQGGKTIANAQSKVDGVTGNSITPDFCTAQKKVFGDEDTFSKHGGWKSMSSAMADGMVLVMSLWDDHYANMLWLDSNYPTDADKSKPGVARGTCATDSGVPADIESSLADAQVTYSNLKFGAINSTFTAA